MIAYLQKSEGSEGFHQIIDFLTASHIKYALTENPTIYVSLIEQFWQTATASTLEDGDMGIIATIDGKVKVVSEASIRRHLKLEDSDGISTLSTVEIFEQLALIGVRLYRDEGSTLQLESHHNPLGRKIAQTDEDEGITLVQMGAQTQGQINEDLMYETSILDVNSDTRSTCGSLEEWKEKVTKPKARGISFQDPEEVIRREFISPPSDEELALRLHAEEQAKFERLQKERVAQEEASRAAIYEEMDNIQAMIEADEQLAARVQAEEQELYSIEEKS
ncbi:hypothetical protein Tco_1031154 [Tanacetum coccineum]|uniref:Xylulose kinase-1 n=1 Tax=Tanacetum coccineum TaxID=301880 RepID=A0ABQ5G9B8_9ASTR